jgi:RimJ/RimL family protein N-acetyltransferase
MGQGLMTEALRVVQPFAFKQLVLEKLLLRTAMENVASQRLARKCGFRREGDLRGDFRKLSGELIDTMLFGLTRSEYLGI